MREYKFVPKVCQEQEVEIEGKGKNKARVEKIAPMFKGHVVLRVPTYPERQAMTVMAMDMAAGNNTEDDIRTAVRDNVEYRKNALSRMADMIEKAKEFYLSVSLEKISDGSKYESYEDLDCDPDCESILTEGARLISRGMSPGKNLPG